MSPPPSSSRMPLYFSPNPAASTTSTPRGSYEMEKRPSSSSSHLPIDEEDAYHQTFTTRPSRWSQLVDTLSQMQLRKRSQYSYIPSHSSHSSQSSQEGPITHNLVRPRLPWGSTIWMLTKQACAVLPAIALMVFGVIHILEVVIGRSSLLWDIDTFHDRFLPNWGEPGFYGEGLAHYPTDITRDVTPIPVHSHNDYWRRIPLFEALHFGCIGVEADVWHFDDDLYVGHNTGSLTRNRTFRSLYVDPIITILDKMNPETEFANVSKHGVWDTDHEQTLILLVDLKTDGRDTFPIVQQQLEGLRSRGYLTYFNGTHTVPGAVTVVGTGNTPFDMIVANSTYRDIFFDAPLERLWQSPKTYLTPGVIGDVDVNAGVDYAAGDEYNKVDADIAAGDVYDEVVAEVADLGEEGVPPTALTRRGQGDTDAPTSAFNNATSYYASVDFQSTVGRVWRGHLSARQIDLIRGQIRGAKRHGLKARYWNTPVWPIGLRNHVWHILVREGADMLNADDLHAAARQDWRRWRHEWW